MGENNNENKAIGLDELIKAIVKNGGNSNESNENGGASDQPGDNNTTGEKGGEGSNRERVFTQDEVSKMMAREKHQGRNAVYKELGIDPDDTSAVQMFKAFIEAQKTDEEKRAENDAKNKQAMDDMSSKLRTAEAKAALMQCGVSADYVDDAVIIVLSKLSSNDSLDVETVAKDLKSKYPVWFGGSADTGDNKGSKGENGNKGGSGKKGTGKPPASGSSGSTGSDSVTGIGKRLAESRKSQAPKKSFWDKLG